MENSTTAPVDPLATLVAHLRRDIAEGVIADLKEWITNLPSAAPDNVVPLWMSKEEAIEYTRLRPGTFRDLAADGRIPSHGGKTKVFNRDELDRAMRAL